MNLQEELKALKERIAELEELDKQEKEFPQFGDDYWYVDSDTEVMDTAWYDGEYDQGRLSIGNVFKTKEQAEFAVEKLKVEAELRKFSIPFKRDSLNFVMCFDTEEDELCSETRRFMNQGGFYFDIGKIELAIESVGKERIKRYIFGVEELNGY